MSSSTCKRLHIGVVIYQWLLTLPSMSCRRNSRIELQGVSTSPPPLPRQLWWEGRNKRPMGASFPPSTRVSLFSFLFFILILCLFSFFLSVALIFSFSSSFLSLLYCSGALQGAGFMSWWGFGVCAGQSDSKMCFYIAYTAIHHRSATPAPRTPLDASLALGAL